MDIFIYLKICTVGLVINGPVPIETCEIYELRPQYEMTQEVIDGKVELLCEKALGFAHEFGGHLASCEVVENKDE